MYLDFSRRKRLLKYQGATIMIGSIIGWILFGLVAGLVARALHPGADAMGWGATILLGVLGSLVGGGIAYILHLGARPYEPAGWILSILGAVLLLALGVMSTRPRVSM
jgi:uncharacterized membrane protein YeaQ/YmgE (transglycosylase-associated protein family)